MASNRYVLRGRDSLVRTADNSFTANCRQLCCCLQECDHLSAKRAHIVCYDRIWPSGSFHRVTHTAARNRSHILLAGRNLCSRSGVRWKRSLSVVSDHNFASRNGGIDMPGEHSDRTPLSDVSPSAPHRVSWLVSLECCIWTTPSGLHSTGLRTHVTRPA